MRISKYIKLDTNILMEYIYDDSNLISEAYDIVINTKNISDRSYTSTSTSGSLNTITNQLFEIDPITRTYGKVGYLDTNGDATPYYPFLQINNYASGFPLKYDTIVIRFPINYTFGEHIGFYIKGYSFDYRNNNTYNLTNFYFDITDVGTTDLLDYTNPPLLYQETLWGKEIRILVPSLNGLSNQRTNDITTANSVNYNITEGIGFSKQSPIFFEFSYIDSSETINGVKTYLLSSKTLINLPQTPEFQNLGVVIQHSNNGDFFEIYGVYNNTIAGFNTFINDSVYIGNRYYVNYIITVYEQNIRVNSMTITVTDNFNVPIEYRPIIKYSSTTAVIDVEMNLIDAVDNSSIIRKASYGMLQDEVSKYSLSLLKINLASSTKPKIYNLKNNSNAQVSQVSPINNIETVNVPFAVLSTNANIVAKSDNVVVGGEVFYGDGKLKITIKPFDNIIKFTIAKEILTNNVISPNYMDLSSLGRIQLVFKNTQNTISFEVFSNNSEINLSTGKVVFLIPSNKINDIRTIYNSGISVFYITATQQNVSTVIYSGLFEMYDSISNINNLNIASNAQISTTDAVKPEISIPVDEPTVITDDVVPLPEIVIPSNTGTLVTDVASNRNFAVDSFVVSSTNLQNVEVVSAVQNSAIANSNVASDTLNVSYIPSKTFRF